MSLLLGPRNRRRGPGAGLGAWARAALPRALRAALALALLGAAVPLLLAAARRHPYFAVREVVASGRARLAAGELAALAGIQAGMSIWDVDAAAVEARLAAHPWVRAARVRRALPRRVVIQLRERRAVAILALDDGLYYVGPHGRILAPVGRDEPHDFAFVTGLAAADLRPGEVAGPRALRRALDLLHSAERASGGLGAVSEIHVDVRRGPTLFLVRPAVPIEVGWGGFADKLERLRRVLPLWAGREAEMAGVSLVFAAEVIVRGRTPKRT